MLLEVTKRLVHGQLDRLGHGRVRGVAARRPAVLLLREGLLLGTGGQLLDDRALGAVEGRVVGLGGHDVVRGLNLLREGVDLAAVRRDDVAGRVED